MAENLVTENEDGAEQAVFTIEKIYVKDLSLEVPNAPAVFVESEGPEISIQLATSSRQIDEKLYETDLKITVSALAGEKTYFMVELCQSALFMISNVANEQLDPILGIACPNLLFPYAREAISDAVIRAGFPPVLLQPVNFEALYFSRLQEEEAQQQNATAKLA